ncbi:hypothetical protein P4050_30550 [Pseudomonas aeruginosa]|nr:hypothetical protein [Pseudomonas aeruginosa]
MTEQLATNATLQVAQADWTNVPRSAFADYLDSARNVAGQTYDLFSKRDVWPGEQRRFRRNNR